MPKIFDEGAPPDRNLTVRNALVQNLKGLKSPLALPVRLLLPALSINVEAAACKSKKQWQHHAWCNPEDP